MTRRGKNAIESFPTTDLSSTAISLSKIKKYMLNVTQSL